MKKTKRIILLCISLMMGMALHAQSRYSVFVDNQPLSTAMKLISAQSEYKFVYNNDLIDVSKIISVDAESDSIAEILNEVFGPCGVKYTIMGKQIALSVPEVAQAQVANGVRTRLVQGTVTDNTGDPLAGADVMIAGSRNGTFTDMNGRYSLEVPSDPNTTLVFNFIGMREVSEQIGKRSTINVILEEEASALDQIVVTGYQTLSRERSAGSFSSVGGAEVRSQANVEGNILRSLEGRAAGLSVTQTGDGVRYLIRGVSSINSKTDPLFIVDGVAMTKSQMDKMVNPNDVESINFLKDATAASIWGAQAANGVIVVTTKTGSASNKLTVSYNGSFTFHGKPNYSYMNMMDSRAFIDSVVDCFDPQTYKWEDINKSIYGLTRGDYRVVLPHENALYKYYRNEISIDERDAILDGLSSVNGRKNYEKAFMSNSYITNHSLSFSGGNDRSNFYASLEYQRNKGAYKNSTDDYKFFFRDVFHIAKWATLDISLTAYHSKGITYSTPNVSDIPYISYYDENGREMSHTDYIMTPLYQATVESAAGVKLDYYPVSEFNKDYTVNKSTGVNANGGLKINFTKFLSYEGRFQYSTTRGGSEHFVPSDSFIVRSQRAQATNMDGESFLPSTGGYYTVGNSNETAYTVRNQLNLDLHLNDKMSHGITALAGFEFSDRLSRGYNSFLRGYDYQTMEHIAYDEYFLSTEGVKNPVLPSYATATINRFEPNSFTQNETEYRFVSMYANAAYTLQEKYSANASIRVDQSNLFGSDPSVQFKPIWSVGAIWNAGKEDFIRSNGWINRLNIRASFGYAGNSPNPGEGGPYDILTSYADVAYSEYGLGYMIATPANDKLSWEKTRTINFGVDFAFLGNRLDGSIDLYDKRTTNLLSQVPVDPTTGFKTVLSNLGTMTNRGVELSLSSLNIQTALFQWTTDFNFTFNANKLVEMYLNEPESPYIMADKHYWVGYPFGTLFAYRWAGLDPEDGMPRVYNSKGEAVRSITDIDTTDVVDYKGTTVPPVFGSLSNTFRYGNFDLNVMFVYNLGHKMRSDICNKNSYRFCENIHNDFAKRWQNPGDEAFTDVPAYYSLKDSSINESDLTYLYRYADVNVLSASYIKLREVSFGYRLPSRVCKRLNAQSASVRLIASNLATIAFNGRGIDPESASLSYGGRTDKYHPYISASLNVEF
ncbi:MAG: SusC/RagA family TonB-linked outer membrane protein [Bacteroidales bacterium]|nr:SusC/RagA family TonB-linked outer membrane protein [Candidatus Cryptobacteroides caccocaballi]